MISVSLKETLHKMAPEWRWLVGVEDGSFKIEGESTLNKGKSAFTLTKLQAGLEQEELRKYLIRKGIHPFAKEGQPT